jgi:NAD(P)-dependent dehydrogenase (short-subunit alcohol dehydrogenase family)
LGWSWIVLPIGEFPGLAGIAEVVAFLASDRTVVITGEVLNVTVGVYLRT